MDLLAAYASSDDEAAPRTSTSLTVVNSTPDVLVPLRKTELLAANAKVLALNQPISMTSARVLGPLNPFQRHAPVQVGAGREIVTGVVETTEMEDFCFDEEYHQQQFRHSGPPQPKRPKVKATTYDKDVGTESEHGIWAPVAKENLFWVPSDKERGTMTDAQKELLAENERKKASRNREEEADIDFDRMIERKVAHLLPPRLAAGATAIEPKTAYLGENEFDYQGRSWVDQYPRDLKPGLDHKVFLPKKPIFQFEGHTKGVQAIELIPKYGHLCLSASLDGTVRIWDMNNDHQCKRIYQGHKDAVRAINFAPDGATFLTASFDRYMRLWDTETGQVKHTFTNRRVPYCKILIWEWGIPVPIKYVSEPGMHSMPSTTLHPSGSYFAGQCLSNQIDVYTARDKFKLQRKKTFRGHSYACQVNFSPNGQYVVSGDGEGHVAFWDWKTTKMYKKMKEKAGLTANLPDVEPQKAVYIEDKWSWSSYVYDPLARKRLILGSIGCFLLLLSFYFGYVDHSLLVTIS
ncbi:hypothetical protein DYB35_007946 [Aphanomyces astaci]|uniref:Uncharacterized protein n=2 Tax=Aphanomyces astaci TaxID=112090 RepID=A0A418DWX9_APHAT|nr:hypothetical protein DYB35_007946 [Aphanomyces astaci]